MERKQIHIFHNVFHQKYRTLFNLALKYLAFYWCIFLYVKIWRIIFYAETLKSETALTADYEVLKSSLLKKTVFNYNFLT